MLLVVVEERARAGPGERSDARALTASGERADGGTARGSDAHPLRRFHVPFMTNVARACSGSRPGSCLRLPGIVRCGDGRRRRGEKQPGRKYRG